MSIDESQKEPDARLHGHDTFVVKPIFWLWLPIAWMAMQIVLELLFDDNILINLHAENGPHELIQFAMIIAAGFVAMRTLHQMDRSNLWLNIWIGLAIAACFYVGIEELSWGQSVFKWGTPEFWAHVNVQGETNLHNSSTWLNQKPRSLLSTGAVGGTLVLPLVQRWKPEWVPKKFEIIYPPVVLGVSAGMYLFVSLADRLGEKLFDIDVFARPSEIEEIYLYYFVLIYLIVLKRRLVGAKAAFNT